MGSKKNQNKPSKARGNMDVFVRWCLSELNGQMRVRVVSEFG